MTDRAEAFLPAAIGMADLPFQLACGNNIYFVLYEEPDLEEKFVAEYQEYKKNVPRWIPRRKPFIPESELK